MTVKEFDRRVTETLVNAPAPRQSLAKQLLESYVENARQRGDAEALALVDEAMAGAKGRGPLRRNADEVP